MRSLTRWLLSAATLASLATTPALAQRFGYDNDGPPPFRRGPGWDGAQRGELWHYRRWRDEGFERRGWRDGDRRERFGDDGGNRNRFRNDDGRRAQDDGEPPRRGGSDRFAPRAPRLSD